MKRSVRSRLMVHQVVASIRSATTLSFDFVVWICLASMLAAFGLLENSAVIIRLVVIKSPAILSISRKPSVDYLAHLPMQVLNYTVNDRFH